MKSQKERKRKKNSLYYARGRQVREDEGIKEVPKEKRKKKKNRKRPPFFSSFLSFSPTITLSLNLLRDKKLTPIQSSFNLLRGTIHMTAMFMQNMFPELLSGRILLLPTRALVDFAMIPYSITTFFPPVFVLMCSCAPRFY